MDSFFQFRDKNISLYENKLDKLGGTYMGVVIGIALVALGIALIMKGDD